ncbi:MAG: hypothetical protein KBT13_08700 [Bacteroidales bacterium]|nr:hypothetical protein [Candidatus Sodaliphilus limicaballi]
MKRLFYLIALAVAVSACSQNENVNENENENLTKMFTFNVKGAFETQYDDMTRAVSLSENNTAGVTDLWVLD